MSRIAIGLIVETAEQHIEVNINMEKAIEEDHVTLIITEMILDESTLEKHKIIEDKIKDVDTEGNIEIIILKEAEVGIDGTQIILEGMIKSVVGLVQVQELAQIEIELDAISGGNVIILLQTVQFHRQKMHHSKYNRCIMWTKTKQ